MLSPAALPMSPVVPIPPFEGPQTQNDSKNLSINMAELIVKVLDDAVFQIHSAMSQTIS